MTGEPVKVRKIIYNGKGFQRGVVMPPFYGTIDEAFDHYSNLWMKQYSDKNGNLVSSVSEYDVSMIEEFTVKDDDYFYIGLPSTHAYEGITSEYTGYGCALDMFGFEKMKDNNGKDIPYIDTFVE
jgi:hypothetical protein